MKRKNTNKVQLIAGSLAIVLSLGFVGWYSANKPSEKSKTVAGLEYNKKFDTGETGTPEVPDTFSNITNTGLTSQELLGKNEKVAKLWFDLRKSKKGDSKTHEAFKLAMIDLLQTGETPQVARDFVLQAVDTEQTGFQTYTFTIGEGILRVYCVVLDPSFGQAGRFDVFYQYSESKKSVAGTMNSVGIMPTSWMQGKLTSGGDYVLLGGTVMNEHMYSPEETQGLFGITVVNGNPEPLSMEMVGWKNPAVTVNSRNNFMLLTSTDGSSSVFFFNNNKGDLMDTSKLYLILEDGGGSSAFKVSAEEGQLSIKQSSDFKE